jgi:hypothetical protein
MIAQITMFGRITAHESPNILIGGKRFFVPVEKRSEIQEQYKEGKAVKAEIENGTLITIDYLKGQDLEKFLKSEENSRSQLKQSGTRMVVKETPESQEPETKPAGKVKTEFKKVCPLMSRSSISPVNCVPESCMKVVTCLSEEIDAMEKCGFHERSKELVITLSEIMGTLKESALK